MKNVLLISGILFCSVFSIVSYGQTSGETKNNLPMAVAIDSQGASVAVLGKSKLQVWDVSSGKLAKQLSNRLMVSLTLAFTADGNTLALADFDGIKLWDLKTGRSSGVLSFDNPSSVSSLRYSANGKLLAVGDSDGTMILVDTDLQQELDRIKGHQQNVSTLSFSPSNKLLASGGWDNVVHVWDISSGKLKPLLQLNGHTNWIDSVAFSKDSRRLVSGGNDGLVNVWSVADGKNITSIANVQGLPIPMSVASVMFIDDDASVLGLSLNSCVIWNAATGNHIRTIEATPVGAQKVELTKDKKLVIIGSDGTVQIRDLSTGELKMHFSVVEPT